MLSFKERHILKNMPSFKLELLLKANIRDEVKHKARKILLTKKGR